MNAELIASFAASVTATLGGLNGLRALLNQERDALLGNDPSVLQAVTARKIATLTSVENALRQLDRLLTEAACEKGIDGGDQLLQAHTHPSELAADWQALKDLSHQLASMNSANGHLLNQARAGNRAALSAITGRSADLGAYDKRGQGRSKLPGYKLGQA